MHALRQAGSYTGNIRRDDLALDSPYYTYLHAGLPPGVVAAAIAALELIESDPDYAALPLTKAKAFTALLGLSEAESPIVPIVLGDSERTLLASRLLEEEGFLVVAIRPPTVPDGKARLRVTFTAAHKDEDIARLIHHGDRSCVVTAHSPPVTGTLIFWSSFFQTFRNELISSQTFSNELIFLRLF